MTDNEAALDERPRKENEMTFTFGNILNLVAATLIGAFVGWDLFDVGLGWWASVTLGGVTFLIVRMDWGPILRGKHFDD